MWKQKCCQLTGTIDRKILLYKRTGLDYSGHVTSSTATAQAKELKTTISATDFKAQCLALLDQMENNGEPITITRRGYPVAVLHPAPKDAWTSPADSWQDKAEILGDIVHTDVTWEATT